MSEDVENPTRTSLRCRLGFHKWLGLRRGSGEKYSLCARCGKVDDDGPTTHWSAGFSSGM
jgi:hypothetical protein